MLKKFAIPFFLFLFFQESYANVNQINQNQTNHSKMIQPTGPIFLLFFLFQMLGANPLVQNYQNPQIDQLKIKGINNFTVLVKKNTCDQVLYNVRQVRCYSYTKKESLFNIYYLDSDVSKSIKKRMNFREDRRLPKKLHHIMRCYKRNKYHMDRGHLAPDASFDYNKIALKTTYLSSNVIPEYYVTNRISIAKIEGKIRNIAIKYPVIVITGSYGNIGTIGKPNEKIYCPVIPSTVYKIVYIKVRQRWKFYSIYYFYNDPANSKRIVSSRRTLDLIKLENKIKIKILTK